MATRPRKRPPPAHEQIARRAHEIWLARGGGAGHEQEDWLQAERELRQSREAVEESRPKRTAPRERKPARGRVKESST
jgi:hypothetical protein